MTSLQTFYYFSRNTAGSRFRHVLCGSSPSFRSRIFRTLTTSQTDDRHSIIVGGGFVGLSSALHLQRIGRRVTLIDSSPEIGGTASCSYGNAGTMAMYANVPVNSPSIFGKLPNLLLDECGPLSIKPSWHLPKMIPWATLFAWNCRPSAVEHTAASLGALLLCAESGWESVWKQAGINMNTTTRVKEGYLILQRTESDMQNSRVGADLRKRFVPNLRMRALTRDEVLELEPNLDPKSCEGGAWFFPEAWYLKDPGALMKNLASSFKTQGGTIKNRKAVTDIQEDNTNSTTVRALLDDDTHVSADEIVIAAGAHSAHLVSSAMGEFCPLETERGYSVTFSKNSDSLLTRAVCDPSAGWIATPMSGGLRVAGKVELGGVNAPPTPARWNQIERETRTLLGDEGLGERIPSKDWLGFRPTMPDALPVIGRSQKLPKSVFYAFGHQHVGWTLGGITGQLVSEMVQGKKPSVDLAPYALSRFRFRNQIGGQSIFGNPKSGVNTQQQRCFSSSSSDPPADSLVKLRPLPEKMEHISYKPACSSSDLILTQSPLPAPFTPNDVLIQVEYAGVGGTDLAQRLGNFNPKKGSPDHHLIMGLEVSGLVAQAGEDVTDFKEGDRVAALLYGGGYAQYALVPQQQVLKLPNNLSLEEGAAIPENFWTVYCNLFEVGSFGNLSEKSEEKTLLVHGGAGGIGSTAVLLGKALGVQKVITTVSGGEKAEAVKRFGADVVIDYTKSDFVEETMKATDGRGADVILCFLGGDYTPRNIDALAPFGRLVQLGLRRGKEISFDFKALMNKWGTMSGGHLRPRTLEQKEITRNALRETVMPLFENGTLQKPKIMKVLDLKDAGEAHKILEEGKAIGKVVLKT
eukprot:CAMPEP_0194136824 /NCGR_PEP_ID=MMETSP0152-20130528/6800_1 /TAXON_ID=1049557 /ORGANISM="Thalassiothrix antarctica, Strain L6-D1" /LENGTH=861 /DNA_ID=CAMNT_0038833627 /DNA_START=155 /DNA_END=2740 /DNA_ORIENTATION=+